MKSKAKGDRQDIGEKIREVPQMGEKCMRRVTATVSQFTKD